jgi:hypothetical protein
MDRHETVSNPIDQIGREEDNNTPDQRGSGSQGFGLFYKQDDNEVPLFLPLIYSEATEAHALHAHSGPWVLELLRQVWLLLLGCWAAWGLLRCGAVTETDRHTFSKFVVAIAVTRSFQFLLDRHPCICTCTVAGSAQTCTMTKISAHLLHSASWERRTTVPDSLCLGHEWLLQQERCHSLTHSLVARISSQ